MDGILLIDKPLDWTSADVVRKIKNLTRAKKVGHAGTLDPRATGLLVLLLGSATKRSNEFLNGIKEYEGQVTLGFTSDSGDSDGKLTAKNGLRDYSLAEVEQALQSFLGESNQVPPMYSAKKIGGKKLYELARQGKEVERVAAKITIYEIELLSYDFPTFDFRVRCSKGTYVRQLAVDLGEKLGCGGYLSGLRRTYSEPFSIKEAHAMDEIKQLVEQEKIAEVLI